MDKYPREARELTDEEIEAVSGGAIRSLLTGEGVHDLNAGDAEGSTDVKGVRKIRA